LSALDTNPPIRALISAGWGGLGGIEIPEHVFILGNVPHDWLFERVRSTHAYWSLFGSDHHSPARYRQWYIMEGREPQPWDYRKVVRQSSSLSSVIKSFGVHV
jgi:hypothetical protein